MPALFLLIPKGERDNLAGVLERLMNRDAMNGSVNRFEPRPVCSLGVWDLAGWRLKAYGIAFGRPRPREELVEAAREVVADHLERTPTRHQHYGVGFVGIHDGRGENQVFIDRWINSNELLHEYYVSPSDDPTNLMVADADHNSVCVWDMALQWREREAWIRHVIGPEKEPDLEAYLRDAWEGEA